MEKYEENEEVIEENFEGNEQENLCVDSGDWEILELDEIEDLTEEEKESIVGGSSIKTPTIYRKQVNVRRGRRHPFGIPLEHYSGSGLERISVKSISDQIVKVELCHAYRGLSVTPHRLAGLHAQIRMVVQLYTIGGPVKKDILYHIIVNVI